jgi:hypothetical protein
MNEKPTHMRRDLVQIARVVLVHPSLWVEALQASRRIAKTGWWRTPPFLPLPGSKYWAFRKVTVFGGDGTGRLTDEQVLGYLTWSKRMKPRP